MTISDSNFLTELRQLDKLPLNPKPREFLNNPPKRILHILTDGITPNAFKLADTPTFDALAARGVRAEDARSIFPTITGPAHTSMLTGARVGTHGFLYPKMLDAYGNRLLDFSEGLMRAETIAEAWRPYGITSADIGSRFLRGADMMVNEGVFGQDYIDITDRAIAAIREWQPHYLLVVYYVADTAGHVYGPESDETLWAIQQMDEMTARLLDAYSSENLDQALTVVVNADHGMMPVNETIDPSFVEQYGALPHGRVALAPRGFDRTTFDALINDPRVEDILTQDELEILGAAGPRWGEMVLLLREGLMFESGRTLLGYHGAPSRSEQHIPLLLSGASVHPGAALDTCELIDLAPTMSVLVGGAIPENNQGRILWEALDGRAGTLPAVNGFSDLLHERDRGLDELKKLKRERANGSMYSSDYENARAELLAHTRAALADMDAARQRLQTVYL